MIFALIGCALYVAPADPADCDPRTLEPGEVRVRRVPCDDELIDNGEGRVGDWLIENAVARFVVRGPYASLTELDEIGGTLIDAARPDGQDLLSELTLAADRSVLEAVEGDGVVELVAPGLRYRLRADSDVLEVEGTGALDGRLLGLPSVARAGLTLRSGDDFLGVAATLTEEAGPAWFTGATGIALSPERLWPDGEALAGEADADAVRVEVDGQLVDRLPVVDGAYDSVGPAGATLLGERAGCTYSGLAPVACGALYVRVGDNQNQDLRAVLTDGTESYVVPRGGGTVPVGPTPRPMVLWAGPAHSAYAFNYLGDGQEIAVVLPREVTADGWALADLAVEVTPDEDQGVVAADALHLRAGLGVDYAVILADDEIGVGAPDDHDPIIAISGSRADGRLWSWPWTTTSKKAAHGAVDWRGLAALDVLSVSAGKTSDRRISVVNATQVEAMLAEAPTYQWDPLPHGFALASLADLTIYLDLIAAYVPVAAVGPLTWVRYDSALNDVAVERGLIEAQTVASNGPRLDLSVQNGPNPAYATVRITVEAPMWMGMETLSLHTPEGTQTIDLDETMSASFYLPATTAWVVASANGRKAAPFSETSAWAVSSPVWMAGP